jgi:signal peptidase
MKRAALRAGKALESLITVAAVLVLTATVALILVPRVMGWQPVVVLSGSMEPKIPVGGLAFLAPVHPDEVETGDVISYRLGNVRVTHRVVEVLTDDQVALAFRTKGDANNDVDAGVVSASQVEGREVWTVPRLGRVAQLLDSRLGFFALVALPALVIAAGEVMNIIKQVRALRTKVAQGTFSIPLLQAPPALRLLPAPRVMQEDFGDSRRPRSSEGMAAGLGLLLVIPALLLAHFVLGGLYHAFKGGVRE